MALQLLDLLVQVVVRDRRHQYEIAFEECVVRSTVLKKHQLKRVRQIQPHRALYLPSPIHLE